MANRLIESRLTPLKDSYETCERTKAVLRISTGELHPSRVSELLQIQATDLVIRGESWPQNGAARAPVGRLNLWMLDSEGAVSSLDLRRHLDWILAAVSPHKEALLHLQDVPDVKMDVTCVWWSRYGDGGPTLWPEQMAALADLNLELSIDVGFYGPEE